MISLKSEQLVALSRAPEHLPKRSDGRPIHVAAVYRWASQGVRGVVLETLQVGGQRFTSVEALQRFAEALTVARQEAKPNRRRERSARSREADVRRAEAEAARLLGKA